MKGIDEKILSKIRSYITIYGSGAVNINTAIPEALLSLGIDDILLD